MSEASTGTWSSAESQSDKLAEPACPWCKGVGFVYPILPSGGTDFSSIVPCRCRRKELRKEKLSELQRKSNIGALSRLTFKNLTSSGRQGDSVSQGLFKQAYEAAKTFAESPSGWLVLIGPNGSGKTHLACAIANHCLSRGDSVFYVSTADLLDHLRAAFSPNSEVSQSELFEYIKSIPLLILDDLTTANTTPWAKGKLVQLLDHRFNTHLSTVITSREHIEECDQGLKGHLSDTELCTVYNTGVSPSLVGSDNLDLPLFRKMTFKNFDYKRLNLTPEERQNLEQAFNLAFNFAQSPQGWLVFQGVNGCGKTHLAVAIANFLKQEGKKVLFIIVPDLLDYLRSTYNPESQISYDDEFERIKKEPILILVTSLNE
jgi:DNA replication protein DnaC